MGTIPAKGHTEFLPHCNSDARLGICVHQNRSARLLIKNAINKRRPVVLEFRMWVVDKDAAVKYRSQITQPNGFQTDNVFN